MTTPLHPLLNAPSAGFSWAGPRLRVGLAGLLLCACTAAFGAAAVTAVNNFDSVHFPDPKLSSCVTQALQKAGGIPANELTSLTCNAMGISNAAGVNGLVKLKRLSLFGNKLKSIDLSGLTGLENLNLANNALTDIDLSDTKSISTLYLFGNRLVQLNLTELKQLVKLKAEKNQLLTVEFARESALEKVYLFNNEMVDIVINTLPKLKFIDVRSNPMPDEVYDYLDTFNGVKASHDGNTEDWK